MKEEIQKLLDLQEIDLEIIQLKEQLILYPPMLKQLEYNLNRHREEHKALMESKKTHHKTRRDLEKEIEFLEEQVNKKVQQQMSPKIKQDAYDALKHEIDQLKEQIGGIEDKILASITEEEELDSAISRGDRNLKQEEEESGAEIRRIQDQVKSKKERLALREKERETSKNLVPQQILAYYKRFFKSHGPTVVTFVDGDSCGGCHMRILPQVIVEIHKGDKMVYCEGCRRILISEE
jgi:predicted  nucleic acid-binding Zn-ribbon protein